jgi:hypothetical protein
MGSRLVHYYRKRSAADEGPPPPQDGRIVCLEKNEESPFLGRVEAGHVVTAVENNLFRAAAARHPPRATDFLAVWLVFALAPPLC